MRRKVSTLQPTSVHRKAHKIRKEERKTESLNSIFTENKGTGENSKNTDKNNQSPVIFLHAYNLVFSRVDTKRIMGVPKLPKDW